MHTEPVLCFLVDFLVIPHIFILTQLTGFEPFSHDETGHTAQYLSACPRVFPGVPSQDCGYQPVACHQWQSCHQLLIRISCNRALLLWSPAQFCVETVGAPLGKARLSFSSKSCCQYSADLFCGIGLSTNIFVQDYLKNSNLTTALVYYFWGFQKMPDILNHYSLTRKRGFCVLV